MRVVEPPVGGRFERSVAACLAAILETDAAEVPLPEAGHPAPWTLWGNWLATRAQGLVPIAEPAEFAWPGPWLAVLRADGGGTHVAAVAFGAPPGIAWHPLGGPEEFGAVEAGYLVAPHDVALWSHDRDRPARLEGVVEAIVVGPDPEAGLHTVEAARAVANRGLEGDRYFDKRGTFSTHHGRGHDLTLVAGEVLDELGLSATATRRNVVTRGIDVNALVGRRFRIGEAECYGQRLCQPCAHLERLTPGTLRPLIHRGGLRVDVLSDGEIAVGDVIVAG